jgi:perosamine synthetase
MASEPDIARRLPVARPVLGAAEEAAVSRVLRSGWVSQGAEVAAFEREMAAAVGAPHACAVASGTAALHLALRAVGVGPGDQVVTVSSSFIASAASIRYCGAVPVFVDVEPGTGNIDPVRAAAAIGAATRAILCVHQLGMPCDVAALRRLADRHGLALVEDAACAIGSAIRGSGADSDASQDWQAIGRPHGDMACFSFHGRKVLTTGEGGMLTTADAALDQQVRRWRQHGMSLPAEARHASMRVQVESYLDLGYNYRMSDLQAAVGRVQLQRLPALVARRRHLAARYHQLLAGRDDVAPPHQPAWARSNWQSYAVRLAPHLDPRRVMQRLLDAGIATRRGVMCAHREPAFPPGTWRCGAGGASGDGCAAGGCPHLRASEEVQDHSILLPLYPDMDDGDPARVVAALEQACR